MTDFTHPPEVQRLLVVAGRLTGATPEEITSKGRAMHIVYARAAVAYYLSLLGYSLRQLSELFGYKDHTGPMHILRLATNAVEVGGADPYLTSIVNKVGSAVGMGNHVFMAILEDYGIPHPRVEWEWHHSREWKLDYCWTDFWVALEVEGGGFIGGRHTRGSGFINDMDKYNAWAEEGGLILRVVPKALCTTATVEMIDRTLAAAADLHGINYTRRR